MGAVCVDLRREYIQQLVYTANLGPGQSSGEGPGPCLPWEIQTCFLGDHSLSLLVVVKSSCFNLIQIIKWSNSLPFNRNTKIPTNYCKIYLNPGIYHVAFYVLKLF